MKEDSITPRCVSPRCRVKNVVNTMSIFASEQPAIEFHTSEVINDNLG